MKLIKLASLVLAAAGALWTWNAGAEIIGVTTKNTPLNIAITVVTNTPETINSGNGGTHIHNVKSFKITNKQLLTIFQNWASAAGTSSDFSGDKIVVGWDLPWNGDVLVVDKTGTNVLFDASYRVSVLAAGTLELPTGAAYFEIDFDDKSGAYTGTSVAASPGSDVRTEYNTAHYELYDDYVFLPFTDLRGDGAGNVKFTQKWDMNGDFLNWNLSASGLFPLLGDQYYSDSKRGSASASIKTSGNGNGVNPYWYIVKELP